MITTVEGMAVDPLGQPCVHMKIRVTCVESYENDVIPGLVGVTTTDTEGNYSIELYPGKYHIETMQANLFEWVDNGIVDIAEGIEYIIGLPELIRDYIWLEPEVLPE